ncbi:MAG: SDR family oxidoreductase, partial [Mycobacterium sp.]
LDYGEDQIRTMVSTNFLGTVWVAREAVRHFRGNGGGGDIVIVGSVAGLGPGGGNEALYAATKAAQIQFGTSLDREVRNEGIRVAVIAPAAVNTHFAAATGRFGDRAPEEGEFMTPDDIGYAILTTLRQPRRMRTSLWTMWSMAEANG